ncbi:phosphohydrolase [Gardnerella pickettii]|uniref:Phosphohydrolase n=1 Tax=Gardnerella pickettii TaxID=2914924 RepID=A0ABX4SFN9_9BIFI|nr:HD domain-containing protein [Gardnerella pickettii]PKZ52779.1 phosphohydrolase [Gardnerella pickettii]
MLANIPDFNTIEKLHRAASPSEDAYNLIHCHCVVIATISWMIARHQNQMLAFKQLNLNNDFADFADKSQADVEQIMLRQMSKINEDLKNRCDLAKSCLGKLIDANALELPKVSGGIAPKDYVDEYAAFAGGLLHDIGTYFVLAKDGSKAANGKLEFDGPNYILHGLRGYNYLIDNGFSEDIAQFARNHTGVGLTSEQVVAQNLPLPSGDYVPRTVEQEIVMVADKYNSKSIPPRFLTVDTYRRKAARFGEENAKRWMCLVNKYGRVSVCKLADFFGLKVD